MKRLPCVFKYKKCSDSLCMSLLLFHAFVDTLHVFDRKSVVLLYVVHGSMSKSLREPHAFTCKTRSPVKYYI